jgi:antitoxin component of MazEF toxin-antitoxin module
MQYEKKVINIGGSKTILLPVDLCKYLDIDFGDEVIIQDDIGKKGKFISLWKKG